MIDLPHGSIPPNTSQRAARLAAAALVLAAAAPAAAQGGDGAGLLLCAGERCTAAPVVETHIDVTVTGIIARSRVTQRFYNPSDEWLEGIYAFPLPEGAAVDHLMMYVGTRAIEGRIEERAAALRTYERARDSGVRASLVEQDRPNLFRTSVANIGPDESVEIDIELQHLVRYDGGELRLRLPTVAMPRYHPAAGEADEDPAIDLVNAVPRALYPVNPLRLDVAIAAGFPLRAVYSPSHRIETAEAGDVHLVTLQQDAFADRDFVLAWRPAIGAEPVAAAFFEEIDGNTYALLMLLPPDGADIAAAGEQNPRRVSREVVFVIDSSGSMGGAPLRFAKLALLMALDRLRPGDWFDVIDFDSGARSLFGGSVAADADTVERARDFVDGLEADGGTDIAAALDLALAAGGGGADVRQAIFITDGAVGNEAQIFSQVARQIGDTRLFTVGIGAAPNDHFMRKAAHFGRGTYTFIGTVEEISERMQALFAKLDSATLTDVEVDWHDLAVPETWPRTLPDLYAGEPLVVTARLAYPPGEIGVRGSLGGEEWSAVEKLPAPRHGFDHGIARLWARHKIEALMDDLALGADRERVRGEVVDLAMQHHLVTSFTSLVAVDLSPSAPPGATLQRLVPLNRPAGSLPGTATPAALHALIAVALMIAGAVVARPRRRPTTARLATRAPATRFAATEEK